MAGRSAHVRRISSDVRGPDRRRSSSHGDATARVPAPPSLVGLLLHPHDHSVPPSPMRAPSPSPSPSASAAPAPPAQNAPADAHGPKRLGFLGDILQLPSAGHLASSSHLHSHSHMQHLGLGLGLGASPASASASAASSSQRSGTTPIPSSLLPARSHSRPDSALPRDIREGAHSPAPSSMAAPANQPNKGHTSPSKVCALFYMSYHVLRGCCLRDARSEVRGASGGGLVAVARDGDGACVTCTLRQISVPAVSLVTRSLSLAVLSPPTVRGSLCLGAGVYSNHGGVHVFAKRLTSQLR